MLYLEVASVKVAEGVSPPKYPPTYPPERLSNSSTGPRPGIKPQPVTQVSQNRIQITALINDRYACGSRKGGDVIPSNALYQVCNMVCWGW